MSDAVDEAISQIDFSPLQNEKVFVDTTYIRPVKGIGFVNADYIISSLRQQLTAAQCLIQDDKESANVIVEPRVGALGTDGHEVTYGLPQTSSISSAAAAFSSTPIVPAIPEISFGRSDAHSGVAKIIVYAFERETKRPIWQSGIARAESNSNNTWVLGAGPFQKGTIHEEFRFAGKRLRGNTDSDQRRFDGPVIDYSYQHTFAQKNAPDESAHDDLGENAADGELDGAVKQASHEEGD